MCGFIYNVNDFPLLEPLLDIAGYDEAEIRDIIRTQYLRPTNQVINLIPSRQGPRLIGATWWLATHADGTPNPKYASFNSKAAKLKTSPLHTQSPRSIRSVIPATGFCEWQPIYNGDLLHSQLPSISAQPKLPKPKRKQQFLIEHGNTLLMLIASVSKLRIGLDGQPKVNTSVITLPPHEAFIDIHAKSFPLILRADEVQDWLDPSIPLEAFDKLLTMTEFRDAFRATPVDGRCQAVAESIYLAP